MTHLTAEQTANFIAQGNADLEKIKQGLQLLKEVPHLTKEIFGFVNNLNDMIDKKFDDMVYRTWSNTFHSGIKDTVMDFAASEIHKVFHQEINAENVAKVEALLANECDYKAVLTLWLGDIGLDKFKASMKIEPNAVSLNNLTADVIYIACKLKGVEADLPKYKTAVKYLNSMNNWKEIEEIGAELSYAKNGNVTLKFPKDVIDLLNKAIV